MATSSTAPRLTVTGGRRFKLNRATGPGAFYVRFNRDCTALCHDRTGTTIMTFNGGHPDPAAIAAVARTWWATRDRAAAAGIGVRPSDGTAGGRMKFKFRAGTPDLLALEVTAPKLSHDGSTRHGAVSTEPVNVEALDPRSWGAVASGLVESACAAWGRDVDIAPSRAHLDALAATWS